MDELHNSAFIEEFDVDKIKVKSGTIIFLGYESLKKEAIQLAEHITSIEVTDDNIKQSKKLLAAINNRIKELEQQRITIKKVILEPYDEFEIKVKDIVSTVKEADNHVRAQVKQLEEIERQNKEKQIEDLFTKRKKHYKVVDQLVDFFSFLQPRHLNKTTTIEAVEKEMIDFFERVQADIDVISTMDRSEIILRHYVETLDVTRALVLANEEKRRDETIRASEATTNKKDPQCFTITLYDVKDYKLIQLFMDQNKIKYDVKED